MRTYTYKLNCTNEAINGTTMTTRANSPAEADRNIIFQIESSNLDPNTTTFTFIK